ncbi:MAG TPA: YHS domain-containing protein [Nitrososphaerales archaeon]|nr:YHS domain-containing protein [Nitrososphaerales archaeon]
MPFFPWAPLPVTDPVCGTAVDARLDPLKLEYHGKLFYFCSAKCMESFTSDPAKYARQSDS